MPFQKYSIEKDELVNLFQKWRQLLILWKGDTCSYISCVKHVTFFLSVMFGRVWPFLAGHGWMWLFLAGCGWVWVSVPFFCWVWVDVGGCDIFFSWVWVCVGDSDLFWLSIFWCAWEWHFLAGCGWVWPFFGWVWVGVSECDLFVTWSGRLWVSVAFFG